MKKMSLWNISIVVALIGLIGCSNPVTDETSASFYGEFGRISTIDYDSIISTIPAAKPSYTFDEIYTKAYINI